MKPTRYNANFNHNENGLNTYFYKKNNNLVVQCSFQTSKPNRNFIATTLPANQSILIWYPLNLFYDWYYDYRTKKVRLRLLKGYDAPVELKDLLSRKPVFFSDMINTSYGRSLVYKQNRYMLNGLKKSIGFQDDFSDVTSNEIGHNAEVLREALDWVHSAAGTRSVHHNPDGRNTRMYSCLTNNESNMLHIIGVGYTALSLMHKMYDAQIEK